MVTSLLATEHEFARRAASIRLVLTDCDGVLTDSGVYYSAAGEELKRFSIRDGMGVERLRVAGIQTAIITGEVSLPVTRRAEKLRLEHVYEGVKDKAVLLPEIVKQHRLELSQIAYIGDDVNDLAAMRIVSAHGLVGAPLDAFESVAAASHFRCTRRGGHGAFREFAEWILNLRGEQ
ncbi:MAG: HAD-IIIA family hydrolase [Deltaproteobacteria bacterium]|nr:HAD-IIIA family hydrolase [Deltaproteobacteria bacterium]